LTGFSGVNQPNNDLFLKITGSGFAVPVAVEFSIGGGQFAAPFTLVPQNVAAGQINIPLANVPANATNGPVRVQSAGGLLTSTFNVMPPAVIGNLPAQGQRQSTITITGSRFFVGTAVTFGGNAVRGPNSPTAFPAVGLGESLTETQIVVFIPQGAASGRVSISTDGGTVQSTTILAIV
jgi:hypothetical protein